MSDLDSCGEHAPAIRLKFDFRVTRDASPSDGLQNPMRARVASPRHKKDETARRRSHDQAKALAGDKTIIPRRKLLSRQAQRPTYARPHELEVGSIDGGLPAIDPPAGHGIA